MAPKKSKPIVLDTSVSHLHSNTSTPVPSSAKITKGATKSNKKRQQAATSLVDQLSSMVETNDESDDKYEDATDVITRQTNGAKKQAKPSRIPTLSPQKRSTSAKREPVIDVEEELEKLVQDKDVTKLISLQKRFLNETRDKLSLKVESQLREADLLVEKLLKENEELKAQIVTFKQGKQQVEEDDSSSVIFDIIELLANISCVEFVEDESQLKFKMKQTSTDQDLEMCYSLVINKSEKTDEILYKPAFSSSMKKTLNQRLPDYFLDELSFPSSNLNNFYNKINRSLNKNL